MREQTWQTLPLPRMHTTLSRSDYNCIRQNQQLYQLIFMRHESRPAAGSLDALDGSLRAAGEWIVEAMMPSNVSLSGMPSKHQRVFPGALAFQNNIGGSVGARCI